tara:strand:- start:650 stop:895 length:246 start_codon:yes stop_codon:yes gene_type:complete
MEIFNVESDYDRSPVLSKFNGGMAHLGEKHKTYKSFNKAKSIVLSRLKQRIDDIQADIDSLSKIESADDLELSENPFDSSY